MYFEDTVNDLWKTCQRKKENIFLDENQKIIIEKKLDAKLQSKLALRYKIECEKKETSYVYIDSHLVRTLNQTIILEIKNGKINKYLISQFMEPTEYIPPTLWINQLLGKSVADKYEIREGIDALTGATLSARALIDTSKRILVMDEVLTVK